MESIDRKSLIMSQEIVLKTLKIADDINDLKNIMIENKETVRTYAPLKLINNDIIILTDGESKLLLVKSDFKQLLSKGEIIPTVDIQLDLKTQEIKILLHKW